MRLGAGTADDLMRAGLADRRRLTRSLDDALEAQGQPVLLGIGLEGLDEINDRHGRAAGDRLLEATADRLARVAGRAEVARLSGVRFAVLLPPDRADGAEWIAGRLIDAVSREIEHHGAWLQVRARIAIARARPGLDGAALVMEAETAAGAPPAARIRA